VATTAHTRETRFWLANALEQSAEWRQSKAAEYPDDRRNWSAVVALRGAAGYVRSTPDSDGVKLIAELLADCKASGLDLIGPRSEYGLPGLESERVAARYFFDHQPGTPDAESHEGLLRDLYDAMARDLGNFDIHPNSQLARRLTRAGQMPTEKDPVADLVAELRVRSREDQRLRRIEQLTEIASILTRLADTARDEGDDGDRLPILWPTRVPTVRKQLEVALTALDALDGRKLVAAEKLVLEPPQFVTPTVSGVLTALDDVKDALKAEGAPHEVADIASG
jgi:hypothetical protein